MRTDHPERDDEHWLLHQGLTRASTGWLEVLDRPVAEPVGGP